MSEVEFTLPPAGAKHQRPDIVLYRRSVLRRDEIEHVEPQCMVEGVKSHQLKTCRINILNLTAERGDDKESGLSRQWRFNRSFFGVSQPLLESDRRLVSPGIQEEPLCSGWK